MPNIYSTITLVNGNFYAASEQQWRKMGVKSPPHPPHHWVVSWFKLWPTDSSSVRWKITWSVTVQLLWWMRTCMQPVRNSGGRRGANSPRINEKFSFSKLWLSESINIRPNIAWNVAAQLVWLMRSYIRCHWTTVAEYGIRGGMWG